MAVDELTVEQRRALALAAARARASQAAIAEEPEGESPAAGIPGDLKSNLSDALGSFNTGLANITGTRGVDWTRQFGVRPPGEPAPSALNAGVETIGETMLPVGAAMQVAGRVPATAQQVAKIAMDPRLRARLVEAGREMLKMAQTRPGAFYAAEAAGAGTAGAAAHMAQDEGAGPMGQSLAALAGGVLGGTTPAGIASLGRGARAWALKNLLPMTRKGGQMRAAQQMQARASDPDAAALAARDGPEGVSPARRTGDERLLAQERRLLEDDPRMDAEFKGNLQHAQQLAQQELRGQFGVPRSRTEWERSVMQRVAAPGATIKQGHTDEMLDEAYKSFEPLYDAARGHAVRPTAGTATGRKNLAEALVDAAADPGVMASKGDRRRVASWLQNEYTALAGRAKDGAFDSADLLTLRSRIRDQSRRARKRQDDIAAELLDRAEARLTSTLTEQLPPPALASLREADALYRQFKVVEDAVYRSGDEQLTPARLANSLRRMADSPSQYARGGEATMRQLVQEGRRVDEVLGDPAAAARMVRGMGEESRRSVKADFVQTLYDRARTSSVTDEGVELVSGSRLHALLNENKATAKALGVTDLEFDRMNRIAQELRRMERAAPAAVDRLFEDGPANVMQLLAALVGAKSGQRVAGHGMGSSLVLAQFFSNKMRNALATVTADKATEIMVAAHRDPKLYAALLTGPTASARAQERASQVLNAWLAQTVEPLVNEED